MLASLVLAGCFHTVRPHVKVEAVTEPGSFPHATFDAVLGAHVRDGKVDYRAIAADRSGLDQYVAHLAAVSPTSDPELFPTKDDQLAYWINAYNALAITAVIDRPGLGTVVDDKVDFFYATRYLLGGEKVSLYKLENGIVRPTFQDPRVHFALNCQSGGCPVLPSVVFPAAGLDAFLEEEARKFCNNPAKVYVEGNVVHASQIFEWYAEDFEPAGGALAFLKKYRSDLPEGATLEYIPYDWTLIATEGGRP
jgi:hypothetical protein